MSRLKCVHKLLTTALKHNRETSRFVKYVSTDTKTVAVSKNISVGNAEISANDLKIDLKDVNISDSGITSSDYEKYFPDENKSVLEPCDEDVSHIAPNMSPTFNFAAYVNKSQTLQELVMLGVELHKLETKKEIGEFIMKLDFEKDIQTHLRFLHDLGVPAENLGTFITKNPLIFKEDLEDLKIRINYLLAKKFTPEMISSIVTRNPRWLSFSTIDIDKRLGYFQREFQLTGDEVRALATKRPQVVTHSISHIKTSVFAVKETMGFTQTEAKALIMAKPKLFMIHPDELKERFHYVHNIMKISHDAILKQPSVLGNRLYRTKQRHEFLQSLNKAQYDPKLPGYVSLVSLVVGTDAQFCKNVAKTSVETFNTFLKSQ